MSSSTRKRIPTPTIGEILAEEFLEPLSISGYRLAKNLGVSTSSVLDLLHNRRRLSVEMSLRLARYFGNSEKFWLNLQSDIDLRNAREAMALELKKIHPFKESA